MVRNRQSLSPRERKILSFLTPEESEHRGQLLKELTSLEQVASQRFQKNLEENADKELCAAASKVAAGHEGAEERLASALHHKLHDILREFGNFIFVVWDWEWRDSYHQELTREWNNVFKYEIKTVCDFHCTVLSDEKRTLEWAQNVFDNFFTIKSVKENAGLINDNEDVDKVVHRVSREMIPVRYEK